MAKNDNWLVTRCGRFVKHGQDARTELPECCEVLLITEQELKNKYPCLWQEVRGFAPRS